MSMYPYKKPQLDLFYDLVLQANPSVPWTLKDNTVLGTPSTITVVAPSIADTSIRLSGVNHYVANVIATYRRIDLGSYFKNIAVTLEDWVSTTTLAKVDFINSLNTKFGLSLLPADISVASLTSGTPTTITIVSTALCYKGSFTLTWTKGKQKITDVLANNTQLTGRLYPGGNVFGGGRKPQGEYLCYDTIFAALAGTFAGLTTGTLDYTNATHKLIIDYLTNNISTDFNGTAHTNYGGLNGLAFAKYTLPNVSVPEANSAAVATINSVFVITALSTSWFQGKLLMHFKS